MNYKLNTHLYDSLFDVFGNTPKNYITMKESGDVYVAEAELAGDDSEEDDSSEYSDSLSSSEKKKKRRRRATRLS